MPKEWEREGVLSYGKGEKVIFIAYPILDPSSHGTIGGGEG